MAAQKILTMFNIFHVWSIEEFSISGNMLIAVVQPLDAVVSHKNVQKSLGNG